MILTYKEFLARVRTAAPNGGPAVDALLKLVEGARAVLMDNAMEARIAALAADQAPAAPVQAQAAPVQAPATSGRKIPVRDFVAAVLTADPDLGPRAQAMIARTRGLAVVEETADLVEQMNALRDLHSVHDAPGSRAVDPVSAGVAAAYHMTVPHLEAAALVARLMTGPEACDVLALLRAMAA